MPQEQTHYDIDDNKSVDENLANFAEALKKLDDPLASVLGQRLASMSNAEHTDNAGLLDALYSKTAPNPPQATTDETGEGTVNGQAPQ